MRACNNPIKFDSQIRGQNGKVIPLNADGLLHICPNSNWDRKTDKDFNPTNTSNHTNPNDLEKSNSNLQRILDILGKREADYEQILMNMHHIQEQTNCLGSMNEKIEKIIEILTRSGNRPSFNETELENKEQLGHQENDN